MMTDKKRAYVIEYVKDFNATQAAIRAGYSEENAQKQGSDLLRDKFVAAAISEIVADRAAAAGITVEAVLRRWWQIATADPNELIQVRRVCCRWCHGYGHQYQWTEREYAEALKSALALDMAAPSADGGFGFDAWAQPVGTCTECAGKGSEAIYVLDSRELTGAARALYAGVQKTKDGIKILMRDQDAALLNIAKHLGMVIDRKELAGKGGGPIPLANLKADDLTDDQLAALIAGTGAAE